MYVYTDSSRRRLTLSARSSRSSLSVPPGFAVAPAPAPSPAVAAAKGAASPLLVNYVGCDVCPTKSKSTTKTNVSKNGGAN